MKLESTTASLSQGESAESANGTPGLDARRNILVIDDEPRMRDLAKAILHDPAYRILTSEGGDAALELLGSRECPPFDLLLTDYQMPGLRGDELAKRFHDAFPHAGVIIMSGERPELPLAFPCEFISKPFAVAALREKVSATLPAKRAASVLK